MLDAFILMFFAAVGMAGIFVGSCVLAARGLRAAENDVLLSVARFFRLLKSMAAGLSEAADSGASAWFERRRKPLETLEIETLVEREYAERDTAMAAPAAGRAQ